ncbi:MAG: nucleotidyltransferase family protein [bacterium]|nr:nucleotidyltransferase family protein [bacterium]
MAAADTDATPRVTGILLAAGRSSRFGGPVPKQLHQIGGQSLVHRTARAALASKLHQILVVSGHSAAEVGAVLAGLAVEVVHNPAFADGQSTSVKAGLCRVEPEAKAAMFIPCDLPHLDAGVIDRLPEAYGASAAAIVVPTCGGKRRAPVLIDRSLFAEIQGIRGDRGARQLFPDYEDDLLEVEFESSAPFEDLDQIENSERQDRD